MNWWEDWRRRDDLLMRRHRIRREDTARPSLRTLDGKEPKPAGTIGDYTFLIAQQGWRHVGWTDSGVKRRRSLFHLAREGACLSAIRFAEYRFFGLDGFDLFDPLDADSHMEMRLADALQENWEEPGFEVACWGAVAFLEDIWCDRRASRESPWVAGLEVLFQTLLKDCAGVITLAFPVEYEGRAPEDMPSHLGFLRRQDAMARIAERRFGAFRLEGTAGEEGWFWLPLAGEGAIPLPTTRRRRPHLTVVR